MRDNPAKGEFAGFWFLVHGRRLSGDALRYRFAEVLHEGILGGTWCAVRSDTGLDGDGARLVFAERGVDDPAALVDTAVHDGEVFFLDLPVFPELAQLEGGRVGLGDEDKAAGFAVQAVDQVRFGSGEENS